MELSNTADGGTEDTTVTTANSGGASGNAFNAVVGTPTITFDNEHAYGARAYKVIGAGSAQQLVWTSTSVGTITQAWGRFYIWSNGAPSAATGVVRFVTGGSQAARIRYDADGRITLSDAGNAAEVTTTNPIPTGQWVRVEWHAQFVAVGAAVELRVYHSADSTTATEVLTTTAAGMGVNCDRVEWGSFNSTTVTFWLDNLNVNDVGFPGPASGDADKVGSDTGTLTGETVALTAATEASDTAALTTETALVTVLGEPQYRFAIDWAADGDFTGPYDDVTDDILASGGFSAEFGRDQARALSPPASGRAAFTLKDLDRIYSPENTGSPLAGDILPARPVQSTVALDGEQHVLFAGHIDDYRLKVERNSKTVEITALDPMAKLRGAKISTQLYQGIRTGTAIGHILDAVGWPAELRTLDAGATVIRWWWEEGTDAWDAIVKLVNSEGPGAIVHADEAGGIVFRDRHHRLLSAQSTSSQATITDGADGYEPAFSGFVYDHGWKEIINHVTLPVEERDPSAEPETVWESQDIRHIGAGETLELTVQTTEPVIRATLAFDFVGPGSALYALPQSSGQSLTVQVTAVGSAIAIANLRVAAQPVAVRRTIQVEASDAASITKYGDRQPGSAVEAPWAGVHDAAAIADLIIGARAERLSTVEIRVVGAHNPTRLTQQISRDLSDRIHIVEAHTGLDNDFFIEQIKHRISGGGFTETTFGCERAAFQPDNVFTFDDPDRGFDQGVFGSVGLDQPLSLFLFDDPDRGFDRGVFAT